ncbi:MAG: four helix bundle protein [Candidatus Marinimicrobia bacterium CG08_land_8_20_14_0_20_45_22]|nr:MAG: four helix bundle protein [Candidatus Marinimicrobia bacterium CG08_land_8_20_14_0_20_45_22]
MKSHKDLKVWKKSMELGSEVYSLTRDFSKEETCGITSQIRRPVISIPANIAEGAGRSSKKECIQFLFISLGSLGELETLLIIANNLKLIKNISALDEKVATIRQMLIGLINSLKKEIEYFYVIDMHKLPVTHHPSLLNKHVVRKTQILPSI